MLRYDPETTVSDRVEFENERVIFLTDIAGLLATKARLKLNTKKLYASDGRAVQELLKVATLLHKYALPLIFLRPELTVIDVFKGYENC